MRLIKEEPVPLPVENRYRWGLTYRHLEVGKLGLWWVWLMYNLGAFIRCDNRPELSWKRAKELASVGGNEGGMMLTKTFVLTGPLWTNIYYLK